MSGGLIGPFEVLRELGRGGMGVVFAARHPRLGLVALKVLTPDLLDAVGRERLRREVQALASLDHPHVARLVDASIDGPRPYLAMTLIDGESLAAALRRGPLPVAEAARIGAALAGALEHAHARGVLHRDLKPDNVLVERGTGRPVLVDFGISRVAIAARLTLTGEVLGTPAYMAPEQASGDPAAAIGLATDVHGLGATLYAMLTGAPPFAASSPLATLEKVLCAPPPPPSGARPGLDPALERLVLECLAKDPRARPTPALLAARLARWAGGQRRGQRERGAWRRALVFTATGGVVLAVLALRLGPGGPAPAEPIVVAPEPPAPEPALASEPAPEPEPTPGPEPLDEETAGLLAIYEADPTPARAFQLGVRLYAVHRSEEALRPLEHAVTSGEFGWRARFHLAGVLRNLNRPAEALAQYRLARQEVDYGGYFVELREAETLLDLDQPAAALALMEEALRGPWGAAAGENRQLLGNLALATARCGDPAGALALADRADPTWLRTPLARAEALAALGRLDEARPLALELQRDAPGLPGVQRLVEALGLAPR